MTQNTESEDRTSSAPALESDRTLSERVNKHFLTVVKARFAYHVLLACCFLTGVTDATLFASYGTFVSMQTGNTIFIALGLSGQDARAFGWARSICSLGCFALGSLVFARVQRFMGNAQLRRNLVASFIAQTLFVICAAAVIEGRSKNRPEHNPSGVDFAEIIVIALLSFQAAGQLVISRGFGITEVPTVVITILLCDLFSDQQLLARAANNKRNRRVLSLLITFAGAICGGWMFKATRAVQPSLWLVAALKATITLTLLSPWFGT